MSQTKLKPMSNAAFGLMVLTMSLEDLFHKPVKKLKRSPIKEGNTVVDYGCGPGRYTIPAARMAGPTGKVYAVDIQPMAIDIVNREAAKNNLTNIEALLIDSFNTGLPDAVADVVLLIDAITPIKDREPLFKEIHRLLKPSAEAKLHMNEVNRDMNGANRGSNSAKESGFLFMDSSHMSVQQAQGIVQQSGLFTLVKIDAKNLLWAKII